jgi:uncharacterized protein YutD
MQVSRKDYERRYKMIPIALSNHKNIEVENESSKTGIVIKTDTFSEIDEWKEVITEENVNGAEIEGEVLSNLVYMGMDIAIEGEKIRTTFMFREKTEEEKTSDRISDLEDAVNFLLMGGE